MDDNVLSDIARLRALCSRPALTAAEIEEWRTLTLRLCRMMETALIEAPT